MKELQCWLRDTPQANRSIVLPKMDFTIAAYTSKQGRGTT